MKSIMFRLILALIIIILIYTLVGFFIPSYADETTKTLSFEDIQHYFYDTEYNFEYENELTYITNYVNDIYIAYFEDGSAIIYANVHTTKYNKNNNSFDEDTIQMKIENYGQDRFSLKTSSFTEFFDENGLIERLKLINIGVIAPNSAIDDVNFNDFRFFESEIYNYSEECAGIIYSRTVKDVLMAFNSDDVVTYSIDVQVVYTTKENVNITAKELYIVQEYSLDNIDTNNILIDTYYRITKSGKITPLYEISENETKQNDSDIIPVVNDKRKVSIFSVVLIAIIVIVLIFIAILITKISSIKNNKRS